MLFEAFNSILRYLDDLLNIETLYFEKIVDQISPNVLQLNKANSFDIGAPLFDLDLSIRNGIVSSKNYDKWDNFKFINN